MKKKWNKMSTKKKNILEIIAAFLILFGFFGYKIYTNYVETKKKEEFSKQIHEVTDNSRYFTVLNCIEKYLTTVQSGNSDNILLTLSADYKKEYNIDKNNLSNYIPKIDKNKISSYAGEDMKEKRISKNVVEYYVKGKIKENIMDEPSTSFDYDVTVVLYENEFLFSIRPGVNI